MANKLRTTVEVKGVRELARKLRKVSDAATSHDTLKKAIGEGAEIIRERASQLAPVGTEPLGKRAMRLKDGLRVRPAGRTGFFSSGDGVWVQVAPLREVAHATIQEFGAKHHAAQPFMRPAYDEKEPEVVEVVRKRLKSAIEKAAR